MDEYNPLNQTHEPEKEPAGREEKTYNPVPNYQNQKPKKRYLGLMITVLALVAALLGSIGGAVAMRCIIDMKNVSLAEEEAAPPAEVLAPTEEMPVQEEAVVEHQLPEQLDRKDLGKNLTPVEVYEQTVNSVVGIKTEGTTNVFGQEAVSASAGSGFILTADGYVITNCHVVGDADTISVDLYNGESYQAELIGMDSSFDIAVLKIEAEGLVPVGIGDSDELKVGEEVAAIGNPLGELTFTMTTGIVSALDREINTDGNPQNMIQTNAAINSGNSGGPLFDMDGNVIGVTTAKYSGTSTSGATIEGLGFAIPINTAMKVAYDLVEHGYVRDQAYLGVTVSTLDSKTATYYGLPVGPRVEAVVEGSCAQKGGIQVGDIILSLDGVETASHPELLAVLKKCKAGDTVEIVVYRAGAELPLTVILDEKPHQEELDAQVEEHEQQQQQQEQATPYYYDFDDFFENINPFGYFGFGN